MYKKQGLINICKEIKVVMKNKNLNEFLKYMACSGCQINYTVSLFVILVKNWNSQYNNYFKRRQQLFHILTVIKKNTEFKRLLATIEINKGKVLCTKSNTFSKCKCSLYQVITV